MPSKIIEKIVHKYLYAKMLETGNFSEHQYGYRPGKGTADACYDLVNDLYLAKDKGLITGAIFIDFTKAFDSVIHGILLKKLQDMKIAKKRFEMVRKLPE